MSTPPVTTGLVLWLDADDPSTLTLSGTDVTAWEDKAGGLSFAVGSATAPQINNTYFPRPSVAFGTGGATSWLTSSTEFSSSLPVTAFVMLYWPAPSGSYAALAIQNGTSAGALQFSGATPYFAAYNSPLQTAAAQYAGSGSAYIYATGSRPQNAVYLHTYSVATSMASSAIRIDGAAVSTNPAGTSPSPITLNTIGSSDTRYYANGALAEVLIYQGALSSTDIAAIETYLSDKWSTAGGTDVSVAADGVQSTVGLGSVAVTTTQSVSVALPGVAATAEVGNTGEETERSVEVALTGAAASAVVGDVSLKLDFSVFPTGVQGTIARGFVLVWSAVDDIQTPDWQNVADSQTPGWVPVVDTQTPNWN